MYLSASVLTYNGAAFIKKQLDSILSQSQKLDEIIICDDGSTDGTIEIIKSYQNQYPETIHLYQNTVQLGSTKNMEKCLGYTQGDIVFLADQDDIWLPHKVASICAFFETHPNTDAVFSNAVLINDSDIVTPGTTLWDIIGFPQSTLPSHFDLFKFLYQVDNIVTGAGLAIKNVQQLLAVPFPTVKGLLHDGWIALYYASQGKLDYYNEILFQYRIHAAQQMGGNITDTNSGLELNLALYQEKMDSSNFTKTKAYWNRLEQNLRVQNALTTQYYNIGVDQKAIIHQLETLLKKYYQIGEKHYPVRTKLRSIKKLVGL